MSRRLYTTVEVAKAANVPRATIQYWIATGRLSAPRVRLVEGKAVRLWTETQVSKARKLKGTLKPGPKGKRRK
jgi:excisionase family DNA binding protein